MIGNVLCFSTSLFQFETVSYKQCIIHFHCHAFDRVTHNDSRMCASSCSQKGYLGNVSPNKYSSRSVHMFIANFNIECCTKMQKLSGQGFQPQCTNYIYAYLVIVERSLLKYPIRNQSVYYVIQHKVLIQLSRMQKISTFHYLPLFINLLNFN